MSYRVLGYCAALCRLAAALGIPVAAAQAAALNDTGITACGDGDYIEVPCPVAAYPGQDAEVGRDAAATAGKLKKRGGGRAGFDFTKLDGVGRDLPASATAWDCVRDNVTGLFWEMKTNDGGLRDKDHAYSWYEPRADRNGGGEGRENPYTGGSCINGDCNTFAYAEAVNRAQLCGYTDWRLPTRGELQSIVDFSSAPIDGTTIDATYFPNTQGHWFWSASPNVGSSMKAWVVDFGSGASHEGVYKIFPYRARLVRGGH